MDDPLHLPALAVSCATCQSNPVDCYRHFEANYLCLWCNEHRTQDNTFHAKLIHFSWDDLWAMPCTQFYKVHHSLSGSIHWRNRVKKAHRMWMTAANVLSDFFFSVFPRTGKNCTHSSRPCNKSTISILPSHGIVDCRRLAIPMTTPWKFQNFHVP